MKPAGGIPLDDLSKDTVKDLSLPDWSEASGGATLKLVAHYERVILFDGLTLSASDDPKIYSGFDWSDDYANLHVNVNGMEWNAFYEGDAVKGVIEVHCGDTYIYLDRDGSWYYESRSPVTRWIISASVTDLSTARLVPEWVDPPEPANPNPPEEAAEA